MQSERNGPLKGLKVIEMGGIGPGPLCATLLADMGADVMRIDRTTPSGLGVPRPPRFDLLRRNRSSVSIELKTDVGIELMLQLIEQADLLIDPFRPGVMEKLGLGPEVCLTRNPKLIFGRMTGWGQTGMLAQAAGHDINYLALSGALEAIGPKEKPQPPLNLVADMGGGGMFLAFGLLAAWHEAQHSGKGQVVDVCMTEGSAFLAMGNVGLSAAGAWTPEREANIIDGGAHFYNTYRTADGKFISLGAIEAKFYALLLEKLELNPDELPDQMARESWPEMIEKFTHIFQQKTQAEWCEIFEGTDVCFAPVLNFEEAASHPHNQSRNSFVPVDGIVQPAPTPRFDRTPPSSPTPPPQFGENTDAALTDWGVTTTELTKLKAEGIVGWKG